MFKKKKKKTPQYNVKLTPEVWEQLPKLTKKQIAELLARLKNAEDEVKKLRAKLEEERGKKEPEEVKVLEKALMQKKLIDSEKNLRTIVWIPYKLKNNKLEEMNKIIYMPAGGGVIKGKKGVYKYFAGIEQIEYENGLGNYVNLLVKTKPKSKEVGRIKPDPTISIEDALSIPYIVRSIRSGVFQSPVTKDGKTINILDQKQSKTELIKTIEYLKQKLAEAKSEKENLESELYSASKKVEILSAENSELKRKLSLAEYRAEIAEAKATDQLNKVKDVLRDEATILSSALESQLNELLATKINWILADGMKKLRRELETAYGKSVEDEVWMKIERRFKDMLEQAKSVIPKTTHTIIQQQPQPKPQPKGGGK